MKYCGLEIISINNIISNALQKTCNILYNFDILVDDKNKDIAKLLYNEFILEICDILSIYTTKSIFYYKPIGSDHILYKSISSLIKKIPSILPIVIVESDISYCDIKNKVNILQKDLDVAVHILSSRDNCKFKLDKLMKFLHSNELTFLHNSYKNKIQLKMSLIR
jgi:hypothetical protein